MAARTTVVVTQRERYTPSPRHVDLILDRAGPAARVIVVDGGSPSPIREWHHELAARRDLLLLRVEHALAPSEARAAALPFVTTEFTAFVDNDVVMSDDWLAPLERAADETGAWAVGPLYLHGFPTGTPDAPRIHMAGGRCQIIEVDGMRHMDADMASYDVPAADAWPTARFRTGLLEYHCVLVRTEFLRADGVHDIELRTGHDMYDLCLKLTAAGGECWLDPSVSLFYDRPDRIDDADRELYMLRWSSAWDSLTLGHFIASWNLDPADPDRAFTEYWHGFQRRLGYLPANTPLERLQRKRRALADSTHEANALASDRARRRAAGGSTEHAAPASIVHTPDWAREWVSASAEPVATY
jgi:GT2 family glycosyltransferase